MVKERVACPVAFLLGTVVDISQEQVQIFNFAGELRGERSTFILEQACYSLSGQIQGITFVRDTCAGASRGGLVASAATAAAANT